MLLDGVDSKEVVRWLWGGSVERGAKRVERGENA
jgi:hypothetical protein